MCKYFSNRQSRDTVNPTAGESGSMGQDAKDKVSVRSAVELREVTESEPVDTLRGRKRTKMGGNVMVVGREVLALVASLRSRRCSAVVVIKMVPW